MGLKDRLMHGWDAFRDGKRPGNNPELGRGSFASYGSRPEHRRVAITNERTTIASIFTRIGIDVGMVKIRHVRVDENERYLETIPSELNYCLNTEANIDQAALQFRLDIAFTLFDKGVVAIVPVKTIGDPLVSEQYIIKELRVGEIVTWYPRHVLVSVYDDVTGKREELFLPKRIVAIVENPLYSVMNEPNSTLQRLVRKLTILDAVDEQSGSGKLDLIIQLPFEIRGDIRKTRAEERRRTLEDQLANSKYGVGYMDASEKITQLNRPVENNLFKQVEYLTTKLYSELGLTPGVFDGTASEAEMLNYHSRTLAPILRSITEAMHRRFLSRTARTQKQAVQFYRDPFEIVPVSDLAELADKFSRNEILSANEIRGIVGYRPSKDPKADQLVNSNISQAKRGDEVESQESEAPLELRQVKDPPKKPTTVGELKALEASLQ